MLFPCINCGKVVSSGKVNCPYCRSDLKEIVEYLTMKSKKKDTKAILRQRYKGTIFSLMLR